MMDYSQRQDQSQALFAIWDALQDAGITMKAPPPKIQYVTAPEPRKGKV